MPRGDEIVPPDDLQALRVLGPDRQGKQIARLKRGDENFHSPERTVEPFSALAFMSIKASEESFHK